MPHYNETLTGSFKRIGPALSPRVYLTRDHRERELEREREIFGETGRSWPPIWIPTKLKAGDP